MSDVYWLVSTVRGRMNRTARVLAPTRQRFKQVIMNGTVRLVRNRPVQISGLQLKAYEDELKQLWESNHLEIHLGSPQGPLYTFSEAPKPKEEKPKLEVPPPPPPPPEPEEPEVEVEAEAEALPEPEPEEDKPKAKKSSSKKSKKGK